MLLEIWIATAAISIILLVVGFIYANREDGKMILLMISPVFLLISALSSADIDVVKISDGIAVTETLGYSYLMILFLGLFMLSIITTVIFILQAAKGDLDE